MDESTPPTKYFLSEALTDSKCEPETPVTPDAGAALPSSSSSLLSSATEIVGDLAAASEHCFSFWDLPDDLLLRILMLVDEPTRQFAVHGVSLNGSFRR